MCYFGPDCDGGWYSLIYIITERSNASGSMDQLFWLTSFPIETKIKAPHPSEGWKHRGCSGIGREQVSQLIFDPDELRAIRTGKFPDFKESFDLGSEDSQTLPNNWIPDKDLPGFQTYATKFYNTCREFQLSILLPALALGLDLPKDFFLGYHEANENQLRLLHYPGAPTRVFERDCVVQYRDFLIRWSNDTLKSTLHRVRAPPVRDDQGDDGTTKEIFSMAYDYEKTIECLPGCSGPDKPKKYEPIKTGE
ncbi:hypothetical protein C8J55DRAFT_537601 [Lentinula edodes]|uniref:Isopenicillin N synthase-like Fe(2+) 2OG dioxygenase domain-containing protein n=1 Tax=Lentinula lateritia TaxID=40482 RepID=A0A9W9A000_9AGAR|nr:hypothetical protein C8J55DRAFT_537601 [Lentinula edodes]